MSSLGEAAARFLKGWDAGEKPLYGQPCNGCGLCCIRSQCPVSEIAFGKVLLCPALERGEDGRFSCGLITDPTRYLRFPPSIAPADYGAACATLNGAGTGCDATYGPADRAERERLEAGPNNMRARARAAFDAASPAVQAILRAFGAQRP